MSLPPSALRPESADRIATLDILRGFALLGMIVVHVHQNFRPSTPEDLRAFGETGVGYVVWMGLEQKAWGTFALLFGAGFAVLMRRAEQRGAPVVAFYLRRLATLALMAIALDAFTGFTVLLDYAIWGVPLLFIRKWPTTLLFAIAVFSASAFTFRPLAVTVHDWTTLGKEGADRAMMARMQRSRTPPAPPQSYTDLIANRLQTMRRRVTNGTILIPNSSFALFIIGLLAVRRGIFDDPRRHLRAIVVFMLIGAASWLLFWWALPLVPTAFAPRMMGMLMQTGFGIASDQWLAFTYIGALILLLTFRPEWTRRLASFGIAGRMALTNYVLQCIVIAVLASPFGLGLHLRPYYYLLGAILLFTASVTLSRMWLSRFRYGPLEWGWRSATYLEVPPLLR